MIEVIPNKPEITDELAKSAMKVIQDYTRKLRCDKCVFEELCNEQFEECPEVWMI